MSAPAGDFFEDLALRWDRDVPPPQSFPFFQPWWSSLAISSGQRVLDIGCGTGRYTELLAGRVGEHGQVVGLDSSSAMLAVASRRLEGRANVHFVHESLHATTLGARSFDHVFIISTFPHLRPWPEAVSVCRRMGKPGGTFDLVHFSSREELNALHGSAEQVKEDLLPPVEQLAELIVTCGLEIQVAEEDDNHYRVRALI